MTGVLAAELETEGCQYIEEGEITPLLFSLNCTLLGLDIQSCLRRLRARLLSNLILGPVALDWIANFPGCALDCRRARYNDSQDNYSIGADHTMGNLGTIVYLRKPRLNSCHFCLFRVESDVRKNERTMATLLDKALFKAHDFLSPGNSSCYPD